MKPLAIDIQQLSKTFKLGTGLGDHLIRRDLVPKEVHALSSITLSIHTGEIFALMGPNGAGKTTLLKILASLIAPDSGSYSVKCRPSIMLSEERSFYWRLTGKQNLDFFGTLYGLSKKEIDSKIMEAQQICTLDLNKRYQEYSSGNRQKLALMRCLLSSSKILLMDEPTRSLDPKTSQELHLAIRRMIQEDPQKAILLTTHDKQEAHFLADRIGHLSEGHLNLIETSDQFRPMEPIS